MWKFLRHQNVLPLIGVMMSENRFAMVSEWMINGNINEYVKAHPDADRFGLVGLLFSSSLFLSPLTIENCPPADWCR